MATDTNTDTDDPRVTGDRVRRLSGEDGAGDVTLVGVVHDHPASAHRAGRVVDATDPDVLALELPPLAVPLYEEYADDGRTPPRFGGEMSAAVQAADAARVVGIDGPSSGFVARLFGNLATDDPSVSTVRSVLRSLASVSRRAVACRLAAALASHTGLRVEVGTPTAHDCDATDDPADQAESEDAQIRRARTVTETFGRSDTSRVRTATREQHMADRLAALRRRGDAVAVVGVAHLDPLADRLAGP
jgi:pheromone shutdown protein TraB